MSRGWRHGVLRGMPTRSNGPLVVKIGGSLLTQPRWVEMLAELLAAIPGPRLLVVGGGPVVDGLRAIDAAAAQPAAAMHWRAIDALGITARVVAEALAIEVVAEPVATGLSVLDVPAWLQGRDPLPEGWHVTSDSIAAVAAAAVSAGLLLAKSVPPPAGDLTGAVAAGWVDAHFPDAAASLEHVAWAAPANPSSGTRRRVVP